MKNTICTMPEEDPNRWSKEEHLFKIDNLLQSEFIKKRHRRIDGLLL